MTKESVLQQCTVNGFVVKLPEGQLERKLYQEVAKALELIGGKWKGGKVLGFVFATDPTELLDQIANGEKRNLKKEFQFFATPEKLADTLVELAKIRQGDSVLEPSAGQGAIISAIYKAFPYYSRNASNDPKNVTVDYCELMEVNQSILNKKIEANERWSSSTSFMAADFFELNMPGYYDRIIANPPFSKNQDIDHLMEMYKHIAKGGRLVCVTSNSWVTGNQKKQSDFRDFLESVNASVINIEEGTFKESGTLVGGKIVVIDKPS